MVEIEELKPNHQRVVINLDSSDDEEAVKNDQSCAIDEESKTKLNREEEESKIGGGFRSEVGDKIMDYVYRTKAEEYKVLADLSDHPQLTAMFAAEDRMLKKSARKNRNQRIKMKKQNIESGDKNKDYVYRTKAEEYKMLADLSDYPQLTAMFAAEDRMRKKSARKNRNQRIKMKKQKIESGDTNAEIEAPKDEIVIIIDSSDDEAVKNGQNCAIDGGSKSKPNREGEQEERKTGNGSRSDVGDKNKNYVYRTKAEEYKMLADLSDYPQLVAMFAAEDRMRKKNTKKNMKKRIKKKKLKIESADPNATVEEAGKRTEVLETPSVVMPENNESQRHLANDAVDAKEVNACKAIEKSKAVEAGDDVSSVIVIDFCSSSSEEGKADDAVDAKLNTSKTVSKTKAVKAGDDVSSAIVIDPCSSSSREGKADDAVDAKQVNTSKDVDKTKAVEASDDVSSAIVIDPCLSSSGDGNADDAVAVKQVNTSKAVDRTEAVKASDDVSCATVIDPCTLSPREANADDTVDAKQVHSSKAVDKPKAVKAGDDVSSAIVINPCSSSPREGKADDAVGAKQGNTSKAGDDGSSTAVIDPCASSSGEEKVNADLRCSISLIEIVPAETSIKKENKRIETQDAVDAAKEGEQPDSVKAMDIINALGTELVPLTQSITQPKLSATIVDEERHSNIDTKIGISSETMPFEGEDNMALRKLLRAPRYFDPPGCNREICYSCGEGDHKAAHCSMQKMKKPCYICGGFEHNVKHCKKALRWSNSCSICNEIGHIAKNCQDKDAVNSQSSKMCLRCGGSGHNMFSCSNDYCSDDLRKIQCCVCKELGHLCCIDSKNEGPRKVACYNCGQSDHLGSGCTKVRGHASQSDSLCYNCGEKGHFARKCINYKKDGKEMDVLTTPEKFPEKKKDNFGSKSAPHNISQAHRRKNILRWGKRVNWTEDRSRRKVGWNRSLPQNQFYRTPNRNVWLAPGASANGWNPSQPPNLFYGTPNTNVWFPPGAAVGRSTEYLPNPMWSNTGPQYRL